MSTKKTILVTGATGGIGKSLCKHLAGQGFDLILAARDEENLASLANSTDAKHQSMDFTNSESISSFGNWLTETVPKLDGLVLMPPQEAPTSNCLPDNETWQRIFASSFIGPLDFIRHCIPVLEKSERGKVVIISGISSAQVLGHYATSNVLRTAWLAQSKTLAFAFGEKDIHFNTLSLGGVMTEKYMSRIREKAEKNGVSIEEQMNEETGNVPLHKYAKPEEVAVTVEGLLSPFSDHITGVNLLCDGGFTRAY